MLFIIVCLRFSSSRSLLNFSFIFSILFPRFWIIFTIITLILFQVDCLFPPHLFGLMGFYLAPSSAAYFSIFSFCLTFCVWGLLFTGCRLIVPIVFSVCPQWVRLVHCFWCLPSVGEVGSVACVGFLVEGTGSCVLGGGTGSSLPGGQDHIRWCVLGCL